MATPTANNTTYLRHRYQRIANFKLNIWRKTIKARARVNGTPTYPLLDLNVDGLTTPSDAAWTSVRRNELFEISSGLDGGGTLRIRSYSRRQALQDAGLDTGTLRMPRMSQGDPGYAGRYYSAIANNDYVTCYDFQSIWGILSRIDEANPTIILKRGDLALNATYPQTNYPEPQVMFDGGGWQAGTTFDQFRAHCSGSYSWMSPAGTLTYNHQPPSGLTFVSGYVNTDANVLLETATAGQYLHRVTVTDSAIPVGADVQGVGFRPIFVNGTGYPSFDEQYICRIIRDRQDTLGRVMEIEVSGDNVEDALDELVPGAMCLLNYDLEWSAKNLSWNEYESGQGSKSFAGYVGDITVTTDGNVKTIVFTIESPFVYLKRVPLAPQHLEHKSGTILNWQQVSPTLGHIPYAVYYTARWHANGFFEQVNFNRGSLTALTRAAVAIQGRNVQAGIISVCDLINAYCGCTSNGEFWITQNQNLLDTRTLTNQWTWQSQDLTNQEVAINHASMLKAGEVTGGWTYHSNIYDHAATARYPLFSQAHGGESIKKDDFITLNNTYGAAAVGHYFAEYNRSVETITFQPNLPVFEWLEPILQEWQLLDVADIWTDPPSLDYATARYTPMVVNRNWNPDNQSDVSASLEFKPETKGYPATIIDSSTGGGVDPTPCTVTTTGAYDWLLTGDTPSGWTAAGAISISGWEGDTTDLDGTYNASRAPYEEWANYVNKKTGLRLLICDSAIARPSALGMTLLFADDGANKRLAIVIQQANGVWRVLNNTLFTGTSGTTVFSISTSSTKKIKAVLFLARHYGAAGIITTLQLTNYTLT